MDYFQQESRRLRALAEAEPSPEALGEVRTALKSRFQGIQHLGAAALAAWIRRVRGTPERARRAALGRKGRPGPEAEWIDLLRTWTLTLPPKWWQSYSYASRLFASFVNASDVEWVLELYFILGSPFQRAVTRLPAESCVDRLKQVATTSASASERHDAEFALRFFEFQDKQRFLAERQAKDPDPRERPVRPGKTHDPRRTRKDGRRP